MSAQSEGRRLIRRFAIGSLAAFLATGLGVAAIMARAIRSQEEAGATLHARTLAVEVVGPMLTKQDLTDPIPASRYRHLESAITSEILSDGRVVRVKVWLPNGKVAFSDDPALVGKKFAVDDDLKEALKGEVVSGISNLAAPENASERGLAAKLFETYAPLRLSPSGRVVGVIELYQSYTYVQDEIDHLIGILALAFGIGLGALYLVLMPIVMQAARRLRERNDRLSAIADELRAAESKYRALVERLPAIVYAAEFEQAGAWLYVSPQIQRILGYTPEEWMADPTLFDVRLHAEDVQRYRSAEALGRQTGRRLAVEYRMLAKDGRVVWFRDDAFVITDETGARYLQGVMFDVTESKRAEEALRTGLEREQEAAEQLRALDQMRNAFLQAVSHDLRTPLTSVLGFALTLRRTDLALSPAERDEMLDRLVVNARKLERLLSDLLDVDRLARGVIEPKLASVDLTALIERVAQEADVGRRSLMVDAESVEAIADGAKVERIVENLIVNAARHTAEGSHIWVRVQREGKGILITVEDDGPGVEDSLKEAIFEPFRQGGTMNEHDPGTGIGLSLVANFARLHGGRAWVQDRQGGGASFRVFLPVDVHAPSLETEASLQG